MTNPASSRLQTLRGYLEVDPDNPALLLDIARVALEADESAFARECFEALERIQPLDADSSNLAGLAAMRSGRQAQAQDWFRVALQAAPEDPGAKFNLAWSHALEGDLERSAQLLNERVVMELPQAALLDLQIAHELGHFEAAEAKMEAYLVHHPDYAPLHAAASVLAMDMDRPELAREAGMRGGAHPDAMTTLATLDLGDNRLDQAEAQFRRALATGRKNPRAQIGLGLVALSRGEHDAAAKAIDIGAEQFGDHLGSWIAAGWAHLLAGNTDVAKQRFEAAQAIDDTFGEAHGSLAVIDILEGKLDAAKRKAQVAARLDRASFSAALSKILLANAQGDAERAKDVLRRAMATAVLPDGTTLEQAIVRSMHGGFGPRAPYR